jgi:hypothetical protein
VIDVLLSIGPFLFAWLLSIKQLGLAEKLENSRKSEKTLK